MGKFGLGTAHFAGGSKFVIRAVLVLFFLLAIPLQVAAQDAGSSSSFSTMAATSAANPMAGVTTGAGLSGANGGAASQLNNSTLQEAIRSGMTMEQLRAFKANIQGQTANQNQQDQTQKRTKEEQNKKEVEWQPAHNEFQDFVALSIGKFLPIYGYDLFRHPPSTFAPLSNVPVPSDYVIGPGDEIDIHTVGPDMDLDFQLVVDRNGGIDVPRVGRVNLAGVRYSRLHGYLKKEIGKSFRHFQLSTNLGKLRSIQVFVLGQARRPGVYTVSSLSTLVNTLFASGGPAVTGSMRHIQLKRNGKVVTEIDLYDLLMKGDKSKDVSLLPGDVIYIPPVGKLAAISGSVNNDAIYELKGDDSTLADLIGLAGGLTNVAAGQKVRVERIDDRKARSVDEFSLDGTGMARQIRDGDLVEVGQISPRFDNAITLRGNVASPGRYPWKKDMRVKDLIPNVDSLIVPNYWAKQNQASYRPTSEQGLNREIISHNSAEINWDYAVIQRLRKSDLSTILIPFNLGNAINNENSPDNLPLESGDVVTIFSKSDIRVPVAKKSVYVRLEGEVKIPGIYKALPGETLRQLVARIGGLTPNAYLFGAELDRKSVQAMQQQRLQEMLDRMQADIERNLSTRQSNALDQQDTNAAKSQAAAQHDLVQRMRATKATGRVVLEMPPDGSGVKDLPNIALEDGDRFYVPSKPSTVSVMGMVYNENAFIYRPDNRVSDYLAKAGGPTRDADSAHIYLLRADGSVISAQNSDSIFSSFSGSELMPGDTLVVPEELDKYGMTRALKDWTQIFYQFALGVAGIKVLRL